MTITLDNEIADFLLQEADSRGIDIQSLMRRVFERGMVAEQSEYATITLTTAERDTFLSILDAEQSPSAESIVAAERYRTGRTESGTYRW